MLVELTQDEVTLLDRVKYDLTYPVEPKQRSIKHMLSKKEYINKFNTWLCFQQANIHVSMFKDKRKCIDHLHNYMSYRGNPWGYNVA